MRDIRSNRLSSSSDRSYDSGFGSLHSRLNSHTTPAEREMRAAFSAANEENWQNQYTRHNESGLARLLTTEVSQY